MYFRFQGSCGSPQQQLRCLQLLELQRSFTEALFFFRRENFKKKIFFVQMDVHKDPQMQSEQHDGDVELDNTPVDSHMFSVQPRCGEVGTGSSVSDRKNMPTAGIPR